MLIWNISLHASAPPIVLLHKATQNCAFANKLPNPFIPFSETLNQPFFIYLPFSLTNYCIFLSLILIVYLVFFFIQHNFKAILITVKPRSRGLAGHSWLGFAHLDLLPSLLNCMPSVSSHVLLCYHYLSGTHCNITYHTIELLNEELLQIQEERVYETEDKPEVQPQCNYQHPS